MKKIFLMVIVVTAIAGAGILLMKNKTAENPQPTQTPNSTLTPSPSPTPTQNETAGACPSYAKDIDGNEYKTVKIGEQCWLKENLKVTKNPQGKAITRYCYDNDPKICDTDGGLYDWNTAMNGSTEEGAQGICPDGFHVPKDGEWYVLESGLAIGTCDANRIAYGCDGAGTKIRVAGSSGFDGLFSGNRNNSGSFHYRGADAIFWSSAENGDNAWVRNLSFSAKVIRATGNKADGYSLRCLKD